MYKRQVHRNIVGLNLMYFPSATIEMIGYLCLTLAASILLRVLEKKRKENEIKTLKEKMSTQQGEEKRGTLIKIQELLAQENKTGRRE